MFGKALIESAYWLKMFGRTLFEDFSKSKKNWSQKRNTKRILIESGVSFSLVNNTRINGIVMYDKIMVHEGNNGTWAEWCA